LHHFTATWAVSFPEAARSTGFLGRKLPARKNPGRYNPAHDYSRRIEKYFTARHGIASMTAGK
jgi:hypothetical protein